MPDSPLVLNNATTQHDRAAGAPDPGAVRIDGRGMGELIAFAAQYGALVTFYDLADQPSGTWEALFAADPAVREALHLALDLDGIEAELHALLTELRLRFSLSAIERLLRLLWRLLAVLDRLIPELVHGPAVSLLERHAASRTQGDLVGNLIRTLQSRLGPVQQLGAPHEHICGHAPDRWRQVIDLLDELLTAIIAQLRADRARAQIRLEELLRSPGHEPQAALYNAFAMLFAEARTTLNSFPARLVRFYYHKILREDGLAPVPDQLYLTFKRAVTATQASVKRGTLFPAGKDDQGQPVNYAADGALEVTGAGIAAISVQRTAFQPLVPHRVPTAVLNGTVDLSGAANESPKFPLFGLDQVGTSGAVSMDYAQLGFCIGSPLLLLGGGTRQIQIGFAVRPRQSHVLTSAQLANDIALAAKLAEAIRSCMSVYYSTAGGWVSVPDYKVISNVTDADTETACFSLGFTLPADAPPVTPLSAKPSVGAPKPAISPGTFETPVDTPLVVADLDLSRAQDDYAFALLTLVEIIEVELAVDVQGFDQLTVSTPTGLADPSHNFAPFGVPAERGALCQITAPELFAKPLDRLVVKLTWAGLPAGSGGFEGYYRAYKIDADGVLHTGPFIDNTSFRGAISISNPGYWTCPDDSPIFLFQSATPPPTPSPLPTPASLPSGSAADSSGPSPSPLLVPGCPPGPATPLAATTVLNLEGIRPLTASSFYHPGDSAIQLVLSDPPFAFGNSLYANNLMLATQQLVPPPSGTPPPSRPPGLPTPALPNTPWLPVLSALQVDYSASSRSKMTFEVALWPGKKVSDPVALRPPVPSAAPSGAVPAPAPSASVPPAPILVHFWHLNPFAAAHGDQANGQDNWGLGLVPAPNAEAALYIRLTEQVEEVTLLFVLSAGPNGWWDDPPVMAWEQQVDGGWELCPPLRDTTCGLRNSGIITLSLALAEGTPASGEAKGPLLRVRATGPTDNAPIVQALLTNAVTATWCGPGGAEQLGIPLPAKTITKPAAPLAGVAGLLQPMPSFGGSPPATGAQFDLWLAERLRHKNRAIDGWDYARLVLQAVPSLWQVAVIPAVDEATQQPAPGKTWVVVVAGPSTANVTDPTVPQADLATLANVGELLKARASAFARIAVTNPPYVRLEVHAELEFTADDTGAYWILQLESDLIRWLSPWPDPRLGERPHDYYSQRGVAEFIRRRPYVMGIIALRVLPKLPEGQSLSGYHYYTSALSHVLKAAPRRSPPGGGCDADQQVCH